MSAKSIHRTIAAKCMYSSPDENREAVKRLASYLSNWGTNCSVLFSQAGFSYDPRGKPTCLRCGLKYGGAYDRLTKTDIIKYHISKSPECDVAQRISKTFRLWKQEKQTKSISKKNSEDDDDASDEEDQEYDFVKKKWLNTGQELRNSLEARLKTFHTWPKGYCITPEELANNGFYHTGKGDSTKCAFCSGTLYCWEEGDSVAEEHAKHFPLCPFVKRNLPKRIVDGNSCGVLQHSSDRVVICGTVEFDSHAVEEKPGISLSEPNDSTKEKQSLRTEDKMKRIKDLDEENNMWIERRLCKLCLDRDVDTVFLPCGHLISCKQCAPKIKHCAICRALIKGTILAFIP